MRIALLGCGYVADFYGKTLPNYPGLTLAGAFDTDAARAKSFCDLYGGTHYPSFEALLADESVQMVLNLTNPRAHLETTSRCLDAGIVISPGGFFGDGGNGWFRLALVPNLEQCREALAAWPR